MTACIKGTNSAEILRASPEGSHIFGSSSSSSGQPDEIFCSDGPDKIYFSMCRIKNDGVIDTIIKNFDPEQDKVVLFCSHQLLNDSNVEIEYNAAQDQTWIRINSERAHDAIIAIDGNYPDLSIEFNTRFIDVCGDNIDEHDHHHH